MSYHQGDPNVPAGKKSVDVHLDEPMVLTRDQQDSMHEIEQLDKDNVQRMAGEGQTSQPFYIPPEIHDRGSMVIQRETGIRLDRCTHRWVLLILVVVIAHWIRPKTHGLQSNGNGSSTLRQGT